jgi:hypothetical protein
MIFTVINQNNIMKSRKKKGAIIMWHYRHDNERHVHIHFHRHRTFWRSAEHGIDVTDTRSMTARASAPSCGRRPTADCRPRPRPRPEGSTTIVGSGPLRGMRRAYPHQDYKVEACAPRSTATTRAWRAALATGGSQTFTQRSCTNGYTTRDHLACELLPRLPLVGRPRGHGSSSLDVRAVLRLRRIHGRRAVAGHSNAPRPLAGHDGDGVRFAVRLVRQTLPWSEAIAVAQARVRRPGHTCCATCRQWSSSRRHGRFLFFSTFFPQFCSNFFQHFTQFWY